MIYYNPTNLILPGAFPESTMRPRIRTDRRSDRTAEIDVEASVQRRDERSFVAARRFEIEFRRRIRAVGEGFWSNEAVGRGGRRGARVTSEVGVALSSRDRLSAGWNDGSDFERSFEKRLSSSESTSEQGSDSTQRVSNRSEEERRGDEPFDPRRENRSKVEFDFSIGVSLQHSSEIDQVLYRSRVDVRDSSEVEDDCSKDGFLRFEFGVGFLSFGGNSFF